VRRGQRGAVIRALAKDHAVAEARPAAGCALQLEGVFYIQCAFSVQGVGPVEGE
jgi:hypothetical protein